MQTHLPAMPFRYRIRKLYEGHGEQTRWFLYGLLVFDFASLLFYHNYIISAPERDNPCP